MLNRFKLMFKKHRGRAHCTPPLRAWQGLCTFFIQVKFRRTFEYLTRRTILHWSYICKSIWKTIFFFIRGHFHKKFEYLWRNILYRCLEQSFCHLEIFVQHSRKQFSHKSTFLAFLGKSFPRRYIWRNIPLPLKENHYIIWGTIF